MIVLLKKIRIDACKLDRSVDMLIAGVRAQIEIDEEKEYRIRLVSRELINNILAYSNADRIEMTALLEEGVLTITIDDNGEGFHYQELMERDVTGEDFLMLERGRGVFLVRTIADSFQYNKEGNSVKIVLNLK